MPQSILIIDDSEAIHALLKARLKGESATLYFANNGEVGLKIAQDILPDLILLDVDMPGIDGFEVCRRLKMDDSLLNTPVIFLAGSTAIDEKITGLDLGAVDYITKPFEPAELRARVRVALRMKYMIDLLAKKAQIDALTGMWNRRYFDQRFDAELSIAKRGHRPLALLMVDLDHFKSVNDNFGHPIGDEVLRRVAALLVDSVRTEDVVCRYGGEEFVIIAPNISAGAADLAERLRKKISDEDFTFGGRKVRVSVSIGVAGSGGNPEYSLLEHADAALYRAKEAGRNRIELAGLLQPVKPKPPEANVVRA